MDVVIASEIADLEEALRKRESQGRRHLLWGLLGMSPAALLPFLGLLRSGAGELAIGLVVAVVVVELARGGKASLDSRKMRKQLRTLHLRLREGPASLGISNGGETPPQGSGRSA